MIHGWNDLARREPYTFASGFLVLALLSCKSKEIFIMQEKWAMGPGKRTCIKKSNLVSSLVGGAAGTILMSMTAYATGTTAITQPLENLKTLLIAIIGAVGVIILAKNIMEFAQAYQQQDSSTMNSALKGIVAGIMMAGISTVLTFLGF